MHMRLEMELQAIEQTELGGHGVMEEVGEEGTGANEAGDITYLVWLGGPEGSPYEGGKFVVKLTFPIAGYPYKPPHVVFETKIYHPHIQLHSGVIGGDFGEFRDGLDEEDAAAYAAAQAENHLTIEDDMFNGSPALDLVFKTLDGRTYTLAFDVPASQLCVAHLRVGVEKKTCKPLEFPLVFDGVALTHMCATLAEVGIEHGATVHMTQAYNYGDVFPRDWAPAKSIADILQLLERGLRQPSLGSIDHGHFMNPEAYTLLKSDPARFSEVAAQWAQSTFPFHPESPVASPKGRKPYYDLDTEIKASNHTGKVSISHAPWVE